MLQPLGPKSISGLQDYGVFSAAWYTQGTQINCAKATGDAHCDAAKPCCQHEPTQQQPTLYSFEQLTYPRLSVDDKGPATATATATATAGDKSRLRGSKRSSNSSTTSSSSSAFARFLAADPFRLNPWMAPGTAPVRDPCGLLGGWRYANATRYVAGMGDPTAKRSRDRASPLASVLRVPREMPTPIGTAGTAALLRDLDTRAQMAQGAAYSSSGANQPWKAGSVQEVSYSLLANHGGGVQYRLCPVSELLDGSLDEGCFARNPLEFVGDTSWFEVTGGGGDGNSTEGNSTEVGSASTTKRIPFKPVRVTVSQTSTPPPPPSSSSPPPPPSVWTRVGLPACAGRCGGGDMCPSLAWRYGAAANTTCAAPQYANELSRAGYWGYGNRLAGNSPMLRAVVEEGGGVEGAGGGGGYAIVDKVRVPKVEGDYVVQWRWDAEQTAQVWTQCAVVTIEA